MLDILERSHRLHGDALGMKTEETELQIGERIHKASIATSKVPGGELRLIVPHREHGPRLEADLEGEMEKILAYYNHLRQLPGGISPEQKTDQEELFLGMRRVFPNRAQLDALIDLPREQTGETKFLQRTGKEALKVHLSWQLPREALGAYAQKIREAREKGHPGLMLFPKDIVDKLLEIAESR
jgi:hypothetical protein